MKILEFTCLHFTYFCYYLVFQLLITLSFIASFVDAEHFRNNEVKNFFDLLGRHQAIFAPLKGRSGTTTSSTTEKNETTELEEDDLVGKRKSSAGIHNKIDK